MKIQFLPHTKNKNVASYRLRCLNIIEELNSLGYEVSLYKKGDKPNILILSKRYDATTIKEAIDLKEKHGTLIHLDLCDNHFYYNVPEAAAIQRAEMLRNAINHVDVVIVSTDYLAGVVRKELKNRKDIIVIGDMVEYPSRLRLTDVIKNLASYGRYQGLKIKLKAMDGDKNSRLLWFGNHGSNYTSGGMDDLKGIYPYLEKMNKHTAISLTVISNNKDKFNELTKDWGFSCFYIPWNKALFSELLFMHCVSLIPINKNPFTLAKTSNRVTTSLAHGLTVFADEIEDYKPLAGYIYLDEWHKLNNFGYFDKTEIGVFNMEDYNSPILKKWIAIFTNMANEQEND